MAEHFIKLFSDSAIQMSEDFKDALLKHNWKGNIRELKNTIERTLILNEVEILNADILASNFNSSTETITNSLDMASVEEIHIKKVLQYTSGNKTETARLLGIGLATLYRKMEQYGISK
ncbi:Alginate biosynthesis transcriptional regulatory protein AlgB [compost metagenome]